MNTLLKNITQKTGQKTRYGWSIALMFVAGCLSFGAQADVAPVEEKDSLDLTVYKSKSVKISKDYVLGINRFDIDSHTEILGWRLSNSVYFGRQDGLDSGLTLVWQAQANQVSLSKDGLRLTRRF